MWGRNSTPIGMIAVVAALLVSVIGTDLRAAARANDCLTAPNASSSQGKHWYYRIDRLNHRKCWYLHATLGTLRRPANVTAVSTAASRRLGDSALRRPHVRMLAVKPKPAPVVSSLIDQPIEQNEAPSIPEEFALQGGTPQADGSGPADVIAADTTPAATLRVAAVEADAVRPIADAQASDSGKHIAERSKPTIMAIVSALATPRQMFFLFLFGAAGATFFISVIIHYRDTALVDYQLHNEQPGAGRDSRARESLHSVLNWRNCNMGIGRDDWLPRKTATPEKIVQHRRRTSRSRQIELYRKVAADYDRMALLVNDQRLRNMYLGFAQQWREAAEEADIADLEDQVKL